MNTRQLLSVGIDIGTTTTQVIFSRLELVNRAAVSQVPRYEFIKREISWQSPVFFTPVDKQGELKEAELEALILAQYRAAGIAPQAVDSGAIIITGESAKTRNARPAVMALSQSLGDFVVASAGPHLESVIAGHGAGAQTLSRQRMCRVLNIDIGGGTSNYALFDAGNVSATACLNVGGHLVETDTAGCVTRVHEPARLVCAELFAESLKAIGAIDALLHSADGAGLGATFMTLVLVGLIMAAAVVMGSGNASFLSFATLAPTVAAKFGVPAVTMLLPMQLASSIGRSVSPIAAVVIACAGIARVSPSSRMLYMAMRYIPLIFSRVNRRLLDLTLKPPAAALAGSSVSVPMDTVPSATSVRNLIAAL